MVWWNGSSSTIAFDTKKEAGERYFSASFLYLSWVKKILLLIFCPFLAIGQQLVTPSERFVRDLWEARWVGPEENAHQFGVYHFRKSFSLKAKPGQFIIHLSADNRYRLFVNGTYVTDGPQVSDARHWRFESLDIASLLKAGDNLLAVQVVNYADEAPVYLMGKRAALIVQENDSLASTVNTNSSWKYLLNDAVTLIPFGPGDPNLFYQYYASGPPEKIDAKTFPWGWETYIVIEKSFNGKKPVATCRITKKGVKAF